MKIDVYNQQGEKIKEKELNPKVFGIPANPVLIRQVVVASFANRRNPIADTKMRGEVRGGGKKPWKQKGTGRARHGSIRSPLWKGGGVTFGPSSERSFALKINKKMKKKALAMVFSGRLREGRLIVLDKVELPEVKTKHVVSLFKHLPECGKKLLLIVDSHISSVIRAGRNIPKLRIGGPGEVNIIDALDAQGVVMTEAAIDSVSKLLQWYKER